jgi:hypothetical protein
LGSELNLSAFSVIDQGSYGAADLDDPRIFA